MKKILTLFLQRDQVPDRQTLQDAIKKHKFGLSVESEYVPFECSGYIPCTIDGEDAGFEIKFSESAAQTNIPDLPGDRDVVIILRWGGDPRERCSALIIAAVLAYNFDSMVWDENTKTFHATEHLLQDAKTAFSQLQDG